MIRGASIHISKIILIFIISCCITGCVNEDNKKANYKANQKIENTKEATITIADLSKNDLEGKEKTKGELLVEEPVLQEYSTMEEVDFSKYFNEIAGCAVFYNDVTNEFQVYNKELCEIQTSPCSTFKIISTLMGLESKVVDVNTTMGYNGTIYPLEAWNKDLTLEEAFSASCVWYYKKVIDKVGPDEVQKYLDKLEYGNKDISEWDGSNANSSPELSGFWLGSSLKISPMEQVSILANIFEGRTAFSKENIDILKDIMLVESNDMVKIYGKTGTGKDMGTGKNNNAWFVGMAETKDDVYYFAVRLDESKSQDLAGARARDIAFSLIENYYIQ